MQRGRRGPLPFVHQPLRPLAAVGEGKKKKKHCIVDGRITIIGKELRKGEQIRMKKRLGPDFANIVSF